MAVGMYRRCHAMRYVANPIGYVGMVIGQLLLHLHGFMDIYIQVLSANFFATL